MEPQDARGELPLDLATEVIYTYSVSEWRHIIDLRYFGKTGAPHPNAKIIAGMIKDKLEEHGYDFDCDGSTCPLKEYKCNGINCNVN